MTKRQLTRLCKKYGLTNWQHRAAQILYNINGPEAARKYAEDIAAQEDCIEDCPGCLATLADGAECPLTIHGEEASNERTQ